MTEIFIAAYLGFIQGLTEFLPVSSSGHLVLSQVLFERAGLTVGSENLFFDVLLHVGTLVVVLGYYRPELVQCFHEWTGIGKSIETSVPLGACRKWTLYVIASTLVTTAIALPLEDQIEEAFSHTLPVGFGLILTGTLLALAWKSTSKPRPEEKIRDMWILPALLIGIAQAVAVCPGVSRSGATIAAALFLGIRRREAVTYSFLLSIPAILGGALLTARKVEHFTFAEPIVGMIFAAAFGWFALQWLIRWVIQGKLLGFSLYCFILGAITLFFSLAPS